MKKIVSIIMLMILISSCAEVTPSDGEYIITKIESRSPDKYNYKLLPTNTSALGVLFMESTDFYHVGDTLVLMGKKSNNLKP